MSFRSNVISIILLLSLFLLNCKKVNLPNPQAESLIGEWTYISSSGGWGGGGAPDFKGTTIEFKKTSKFIRYDSKKKKLNENEFEFTEGRCIHSNSHPGLKIAYKNSGNEAFLISNDTLYLESEFHDGLSQVYVRK